MNRLSVSRFYAVSFFGNLSFDLTIWSFFFTAVKNFTFSDAVTIHTVIFLFAGLMELPTGTLADKYGRKLIVVGGLSCRLLSVVLIVFGDSFTSQLFASAIAGTGWALLSGSFEAWMYDELALENREQDFSRIIANSMVWLFIARTLAFTASGWIYLIHPSLPYVAIGTAMTLSILLLAPIRETHAATQSSQLNLIKLSYCQLFEKRFLIRSIIYLLINAALMESVWLRLQHILSAANFSILAIGPIYATGALASSLGSNLSKLGLISHIFKRHQMAIQGSFCGCGALLLSIASTEWIAILGVLVISVGFGLWFPLLSSIINVEIQSECRATTLSLVSLVGKLGVVLIGVISTRLIVVFGENLIVAAIGGILTILATIAFINGKKLIS